MVDAGEEAVSAGNPAAVAAADVGADTGAAVLC